MTKYYLDTSIWLDYYEKRGRNGELAILLIEKIKKEATIVFSDVHITELKHLGYSLIEIDKMLKVVKLNIIRVHVTKSQLEEARRLVSYIKVPIRDALHMILARDNETTAISRDKHFYLLKYIADVKRPEEII